MFETRDEVGLCVDCVHRRRVPTRRGTSFWLCRKSETDPGYPKYPRLPVRICRGYHHETLDTNETSP